MPKSPTNYPFIPPPDDHDDADDDICPVCDGQCTCRSTVLHTPQTSLTHQHNHQHNHQHHANRQLDHASDNRPRSLKIKLTVPPSMLAHQQLPSSSKQPPRKSTAPRKQPKQPKRRRPNDRTTVFLQSSSKNASTSKPSHRKAFQPSSRSRYPTFLPASAITASSDTESSASSDSLSSLASSDHEDQRIPGTDDGHISSDSSASADEDDHDLPNNGPEPSFIEERARLRRELLGSQGSHDRHRKRFRNGGNVRKEYSHHHSSSSISDSDLLAITGDLTSEENANEDENEADEEEGGQHDEADETDDESVGAPRYIGFATGWSDDEESSFDADVFFAGLSDGSSDDEFSPMDQDQGATQLHPPQQFHTARTHSELSLQNARLADFEVAESWDGQIVFTNSYRDPSGSSTPRMVPNRNEDVSRSEVTLSDTPHTASEGGADEDVFMSDGETTEEELVGDDGLPTELAMRMFSMPSSFSQSSPDDLIKKQYRPSKHRNNSDGSANHGPHLRTPSMGGFCHNVVAYPAHSVIEPSTAKDEIPRPFLQAQAASPRSSERRRRNDSLTDASFPPSSPYVSSSVEPQSDTIEIDMDDFLNDTRSDDGSSSFLLDSLFPSETESHHYIQNFHRWDLISVGAFRTREVSMLVPSSPLNLDSASVTSPKQTFPASPLGGLLPSMASLTIPSSPTPPSSSIASPLKHDSHRDDKSRNIPQYPRETKKPKKLKYRNMHSHYHKHLHHPNMKKRGGMSVQRSKNSNGTSSSSPV